MPRLQTTERIEEILASYGDPEDGTLPTRAQWNRIAALPEEQPIALLNFFSLRTQADYGETKQGPASGSVAMGRYAAVSAPALAKVGGRFLLLGASLGTFIGEDQSWDMIAVGEYPDRDALLSLFEDNEYRAAFLHRRAACARQRVEIASS